MILSIRSVVSFVWEDFVFVCLFVVVSGGHVDSQLVKTQRINDDWMSTYKWTLAITLCRAQGTVWKRGGRREGSREEETLIFRRGCHSLELSAAVVTDSESAQDGPDRTPSWKAFKGPPPSLVSEDLCAAIWCWRESRGPPNRTTNKVDMLLPVNTPPTVLLWAILKTLP